MPKQNPVDNSTSTESVNSLSSVGSFNISTPRPPVNTPQVENSPNPQRTVPNHQSPQSDWHVTRTTTPPRDNPTISANWKQLLTEEATKVVTPMEEGLSLNITVLVNLVNARSDDELPGPSASALASPTIDGLQTDLTQTLTQLVRIEHHNKQMIDAIKAGKAPTTWPHTQN